MPPAPLDLRGGQNSCTGLQPVPNTGGIYDTCTRVSFTICSDSYYIWKMCWDEWPRLSLINGDWYQFPKQMTVCKAEMLTQLDGEKVAPLEVSKSSSPGHRKAYRFPVIPSTSQTSAIIKAQASKRLAAHRLLSPPGSSWFPWIMKLAVQLIRPKHWAYYGFEWMNKLQGCITTLPAAQRALNIEVRVLVIDHTSCKANCWITHNLACWCNGA